jgi:murein DD-endopeptidase MepM/ murein hydrolase activator NlpD
VPSPRLVRFPVLGPPGWKARESAIRSDGTPCPTNGDGYRSAGVQHPAERPILYDSYNELRGGGTVGHGAMDITCARGAPVVSATDGVVPLQVQVSGQTLPGAGSSPNGGNYVWVKDADGFSHYYAHMRNVRVRPGQVVKAGELLAECSDTGNARGGCPHLHYAVHTPSAGKMNPYSLLLPLYARGDWHTAPIAPERTGPGFSWIPLVLAGVAAGIFFVVVRKTT